MYEEPFGADAAHDKLDGQAQAAIFCARFPSLFLSRSPVGGGVVVVVVGGRCLAIETVWTHTAPLTD